MRLRRTSPKFCESTFHPVVRQSARAALRAQAMPPQTSVALRISSTCAQIRATSSAEFTSSWHGVRAAFTSRTYQYVDTHNATPWQARTGSSPESVIQTYGGVCLDIGGRRAGAMVGLMNTIAQVGGLAGSVLYGYIVDRTGNYDAPFIPMTAVLLLGAALWVNVDASREVGGDSPAEFMDVRKRKIVLTQQASRL